MNLRCEGPSVAVEDHENATQYGTILLVQHSQIELLIICMDIGGISRLHSAQTFSWHLLSPRYNETDQTTQMGKVRIITCSELGSVAISIKLELNKTAVEADRECIVLRGNATCIRVDNLPSLEI